MQRIPYKATKSYWSYVWHEGRLKRWLLLLQQQQETWLIVDVAEHMWMLASAVVHVQASSSSGCAQ